MATVPRKQCDVFKTYNKIERFQVRLYEADDKDVAQAGGPLLLVTKDLSPRALERLKKFIRRGMAPPTEMADDNAEPETPNTEDGKDAGTEPTT